MTCDLCGKEGKTVLAHIEKRPYNVCQACASYGTIIEERKPRAVRSHEREEEQVRSDAGKVLRRKREQLQQTQKEFAAHLGVKESVLHSWETGHHIPTVEQAKQLEKKVHTQLTEAIGQGEASVAPSTTSAGLTIADIMKKR